MYEVNFLGDVSRYSCSKESIDETIEKRIAAYALIPDGCKVIPKDLIGMFKGLFIGGVLKDSIKIVYGICDNGITGFSCSVFFISNQELLDSVMDYSSLELECFINKIYDEFENQNIINRVEIIGKDGREFVKLLENGYYEISIQDDGKTIKLFEKE